MKNLAPFARVHLHQLADGWQASLQPKNDTGWIIGFGVTADTAILDALFKPSAPQEDPGPPEWTEEDPLS